MKKLDLTSIKQQMLTKEQMRKIVGGSYVPGSCPTGDSPTWWLCCTEPPGGPIPLPGLNTCYEAAMQCYTGKVSISAVGCG